VLPPRSRSGAPQRAGPARRPITARFLQHARRRCSTKRDATRTTCGTSSDEDLRAEDPEAAITGRGLEGLRDFRTKSSSVCGAGSPRRTVLRSLSTKLRSIRPGYRGAFLHGGATPEEMILRVALLTKRHASRADGRSVDRRAAARRCRCCAPTTACSAHDLATVISSCWTGSRSSC